MSKLLIDRSKWLCGHELNRSKDKDSMLLNHNGEMCCLGFLGKQCEFQEESLLACYTPDGTGIDRWPEGVINLEAFKDTPWTAVAVRVNDSRSLSDSDRESILIDHFKAIGYSIIFTGNYQDNKYNGLVTI